jgi:heme-degrading monooxygenase HmoA
MMLRIPVDAAGLERAAQENGDLIKGIAGRARERGAIHHDFYEDDGEVIVVDEWESPEAFQAFFDAESGNIGQLMQAAGATGAPAPPTFHRKMSVGDEF